MHSQVLKDSFKLRLNDLQFINFLFYFSENVGERSSRLRNQVRYDPDLRPVGAQRVVDPFEEEVKEEKSELDAEDRPYPTLKERVMNFIQHPEFNISKETPIPFTFEYFWGHFTIIFVYSSPYSISIHTPLF